MSSAESDRWRGGARDDSDDSDDSIGSGAFFSLPRFIRSKAGGSCSRKEQPPPLPFARYLIAPAAVALGQSGKQAATSVATSKVRGGPSPRRPRLDALVPILQRCYRYNATFWSIAPAAYASPISPLQHVTIFCAHTPACAPPAADPTRHSTCGGFPTVLPCV